MTVSFNGKNLLYAMILCIFIFLLCLAYKYLTAPHTYEDCVLLYLKTDASNYAENFIDDMCNDKFKK